MPFFQGARDFDINGGTFYDVAGNQTNHKHDNSFQISGSNNSTTFSPNLSRNDNRVYNMGQSHTNVMGYSSGTYNYGGLPQSSVYPALSYQEFQNFLAWQQQGSPTAPNHFQSQPALGGPHPRPQIANRQAPSRGNSASAPPQSYPNTSSQFPNSQTQPSRPVPYPSASSPYPPASSPYPSAPSPYPSAPSPYPSAPSPYPSAPSPYPSAPSPYPSVLSPHPLSPSSQNQPPNPTPDRPDRLDQWGNAQNSPRPPIYPDHRRTYSRPVPNGAEVLSEPSDVLSDDPNERGFPGEGALSSLEAKFRQQARISDPIEQTGSRPHSIPTAVSQPSAHATNTASPAQSSVSSQQETYLPPSTQNIRSTHAPRPPPPPPPPPAPPAPNIATKPQRQQQPSIDVTQSWSHNLNSPQPPLAPQPSKDSRPQPSQPHGRPSSSSSSDSYSSESTYAGNKQESSRPGPSAVPVTSHAGVLPTPAPTPPGPALNVPATPGFRLDNQGPLSPQASSVTGGSAPNPSAVFSPLSTSSIPTLAAPVSDPAHITSSADVFAGLKPLFDQSNIPAAAEKKKKKKLLERFGLKKSKVGKTSRPDGSG